jgi:hypothetical protein
MNFKNIIAGKFFIVAAMLLAFTSCQKMDRPELGDFPKDANPPGGPLNFYTAFDGTSSDPLMNAVDSIRATFPSDNPLTSVSGISGKAIQGASKKFVKYVKPNDWAVKAKSFTISFWYKRDGQTKNNTGTNGPEYIFSFKSSSNHWSGASVLVFLEGDNAKGAVKTMFADAAGKDNWFTWEGGQTIAGLLDNNWHHMALVYNATTSGMTLYVDGVANPNVKTWAGHGNINLDDSKITEFRVGAGPNDKYDTDDWLSSTFKGNIDQLRLYSTALSASEVSVLFTGKK